MRGVEEFEPAELDERNVAPGGLELKRGAVVGGAERHRLRFERGARLAIGQYADCDKSRLVGLLGDSDERGKASMRPIGPQILGVTFGRERDDGVGGGQDRLRRAIVALERDDARGRIERTREVEDVAYGRSAERIDRLRVVADDGEPPPVWAQGEHDLRLQRVGVLVFVDEQMIEAGGDFRGDLGLRQHLGEIEQ